MKERVYSLVQKSNHAPKKTLKQCLYAWDVIRTMPYRIGTKECLPSPKLMHLVAGSPDPRLFLESGRCAAGNILEIMRRNNINIKDFTSILDFGCGCGRVIRHFSFLGKRMYGVDYNPKLAKWCQKSLPFGSFSTNNLLPPLNFADNSFDLIYALSVFTHLPESAQIAWMKEFHRILKPNGYLLITTRGEGEAKDLKPDELKCFQQGQLIVRGFDAGSNSCNTYHPQTYVKKKLAQNYESIDFAPKDTFKNPHQDYYLLKKTKTTTQNHCTL